MLMEESRLPDLVSCEKAWCHVRKERFALVPTHADVPLTTFPFVWDDDFRLAFPPGLAFFKAEKSFSHGGISLQELIIPHLVSKKRISEAKRIGIEVVLPTYELMQAAVKVVVRPVSSSQRKNGQMALFPDKGRVLNMDVFRVQAGDEGPSVLAGGRVKEVSLKGNEPEKSATLFFASKEAFHKGELLHLHIYDSETGEQFPPGGIKLTMARHI